jgi:hypothetical protein
VEYTPRFKGTLLDVSNPNTDKSSSEEDELWDDNIIDYTPHYRFREDKKLKKAYSSSFSSLNEDIEKSPELNTSSSVKTGKRIIKKIKPKLEIRIG